jgi:hypothetical protein
MKKIYFLLLFVFISVSTTFGQVVISQVYGGGGNSSALYTNDFIELFNRGNSAVNLNGWSVQYSSVNGTAWAVTELPNFDLQPGQYFLIQQLAGNGGTQALPTPDAVGTIAMAGVNFKVLLSNSTVAQTGACPSNAEVIDFIGVGTANCSETANAPAASNTTSVIRINDGCTDTNNNSSDFITINPPTPRNSASPTATCSSDPSLLISSPSEGQTLAPGANVIITFTASNFDIATPGNGDGHLHYTVNGGSVTMVYTTNPIDLGVLAAGAYTIDMELVDDSHTPIVPAVTASVNFTVEAATQVADLAALRADFIANGPGAYYELSSTPTVTYTRATRNQKYIQDASAGILIDDVSGTIATSFSIGDGISGLVGTASEFNGVLQFVPLQDATVTAGATVTPAVVTAATLLTDWENYESQLVRINNATFADAGGTFATATNYDLSDGSTINFRTNFSEADYIGQLIPVGANPVVGLISEFGGNPQITARSLADVTLSTPSFETLRFSVYPNPVSNGFVTINTTNADPINILVYDVLGKQVKNETITNNTLNVGDLNTGIYILKMTQNQATATKKLIIK